MSNFGFFDLRLVDPYDVAWKEAKSAVGAKAVLKDTRVFGSLAEAVADCSLVVGTAGVSKRELRHTVRRLEAGGKLIRRARGRVALVFGSEKYGLSNDDMSYCHWLLRIPTRAGHESMNLGQAVALCLWELARDPAEAKRAAQKKEPANMADLERLEQFLQEMLQDSGYFEARTSGSGALKLRRLVHRLELDAADAAIWMGMLRQIRWRMDNPAHRDPGATSPPTPTRTAQT